MSFDAARLGQSHGVAENAVSLGSASDARTAHRPRPLSTEARRRKTHGSQRARKHVLLVFQPTIGGVPNYVAALAEGLVEQGKRVSVAAPSTTTVYDRLASIAENMIPFDVPRVPCPGDYEAGARLLKLCRSESVDLIHGHSSKAGAMAAFLSRKTRLPSVYTPHSWSFERELSPLVKSIYVRLERRLARRHARLILVSRAERASAERYCVAPTERLEFVPTGLRDVQMPSRDWARRELDLQSEDFVVGWIGRSGPQKRSEHLPELARRLAGDAQLVALGNGIPESDSGRALVEAGGKTPASASPDVVYAAADALVLTSRWESSPLVVLEAMRAGLPVVSYDVGGVRELVAAGTTGVLAEPGDLQVLAKQLQNLARDRGESRRMGEAARQRFCRLFRHTDMVSRIDSAYDRAIATAAETGLVTVA